MKKQINGYELKVSISGEKNFHRILKICGKDTLNDLSDLILWSLGFDDEHLYYFKTREDNITYYGYPDYNEKSADIEIDLLNLRPKQKLSYLYDFGDEWFFTITVRKVEPTETYFKSFVAESKGTIEQYPEFDDDDDDDDDEYEEEYLDEEVHEDIEQKKNDRGYRAGYRNLCTGIPKRKKEIY